VTAEVGRKVTALKAPWSGEDATYASVRLDGQDVAEAQYEHSTFVNVSFKRCRISRSSFRNCTFIDCYFRQADLDTSSFVGCTFINCRFPKVIVRGSDFSYAEFRGCHIDFSLMQFSLPQEPNVLLPLAENLGREAEAVGLAADARRYRLRALVARRDHLRATVFAESDWYRKKFDPVDRVWAALQIAWYYLNSALWRHGESATRLLLVGLTLILVVFPLLLVSAAADGSLAWGSATWLSLSNFLLLDRLSNVSAVTGLTAALSALEAALGIIFAAMFVSLLIKALLRR
jgi:hypothetical protein